MSTTSLSEDQLTLRRIRPRFSVTSPESIEQLTAQIRQALEQDGATCQGHIHFEYVTLFLPPEEQHYWSPQLSLSLEPTEDGCLLRGLYGPRPEVWTMFVFFYAIIALLALVIAIIGFSNLSLGKSGMILWLLPLLIGIFLTLYLTAYFGKRMGQDQLVTLHDFLEKCTGLAITTRA